MVGYKSLYWANLCVGGGVSATNLVVHFRGESSEWSMKQPSIEFNSIEEKVSLELPDIECL